MYDKTEGETTKRFETWWVSSKIYNELNVFENVWQERKIVEFTWDPSLCVYTGVALVKLGS